MNIYIHKITIYILSNYIFYRILFNYKAFKIVKKIFLFLKLKIFFNLIIFFLRSVKRIFLFCAFFTLIIYFFYGR